MSSMTALLNNRNSCPVSRSTAQRSDGFALVPAILAAGLLALVILLVTRTVAIEIKLSRSYTSNARAEALADGLATLMSYALVAARRDQKLDRKPTADGDPFRCRINGEDAVVTMTDAAGLVDLNEASEDLLRRLLEAVGEPPAAAVKMAQAIVADRRPDAPAGATTADGSFDGGRGPFLITRELERIDGMQRQLLARLLPFVTVYSRSPGIDSRYASKEVLALGLPVDASSASPRRVVVIRATVAIGGATKASTREATIELTPLQGSGFQILDWMKSTGSIEAVRGAGASGDCLQVLMD